jgi:hypothetical protein
MSKEKIISIRESEYKGFREWFFNCGIELIIIFAVLALAIWSETTSDIPVFGKYYACPIKKMTGYSCLGCGLTRAMIAIMHGNFSQAIHFNLLAFPLVLFLGYRLIQRISQTATNKYPVIKMNKTLIICVVLSILLFGALRAGLEISGVIPKL